MSLDAQIISFFCVVLALMFGVVAFLILHRNKKDAAVVENWRKTDWVTAAYSPPPPEQPKFVTYELVPCNRKPVSGEIRYRHEVLPGEMFGGDRGSLFGWPYPIVWTGKDWSPL